VGGGADHAIKAKILGLGYPVNRLWSAILWGMKTPASAEKTAQGWFVGWRHHPMLHDPISLTTLIISIILNLITMAVVLVKVHHVNYPVPVHYLNLVGFDQVGNWYENYRFALFGIVVTLANGWLAAKSFQRHRLTSFFLMFGAVAVNLLCLVVSLAFAVIL